jgi:GNAT superfamily N-acetyltransferase
MRVESFSAAIRAFAEDPFALGPAPPPSVGSVLPRDGFVFCAGPTPAMTLVQHVRLAPHDVPRAVREARALRRAHARPHVLWWLGPSTTPGDLRERLLDLGLEHDLPPPFEAEFTIMALGRGPARSRLPGLAVRPVGSAEDVRAANAVAQRAFGLSDDDRAYADARAQARFAEQERSDVARREYLARLDGEPVGMAVALRGPDAVNLLGGAVVPEARGRGVYRALVDVRWDDAVARGTPALTVQAGHLSRPILERLGFVALGRSTVLLDRG